MVARLLGAIKLELEKDNQSDDGDGLIIKTLLFATGIALGAVLSPAAAKPVAMVCTGPTGIDYTATDTGKFVVLKNPTWSAKLTVEKRFGNVIVTKVNQKGIFTNVMFNNGAPMVAYYKRGTKAAYQQDNCRRAGRSAGRCGRPDDGDDPRQLQSAMGDRLRDAEVLYRQADGGDWLSLCRQSARRNQGDHLPLHGRMASRRRLRLGDGSLLFQAAGRSLFRPDRRRTMKALIAIACVAVIATVALVAASPAQASDLSAVTAEFPFTVAVIKRTVSFQECDAPQPPEWNDYLMDAHIEEILPYPEYEWKKLQSDILTVVLGNLFADPMRTCADIAKDVATATTAAEAALASLKRWMRSTRRLALSCNASKKKPNLTRLRSRRSVCWEATDGQPDFRNRRPKGPAFKRQHLAARDVAVPRLQDLPAFASALRRR